MILRTATSALSIAALFAVSFTTQAQSFRRCIEDDSGRLVDRTSGARCVTTIQTAVPFLSIAPDARTAALGDAGVALSPTPASTHYNGSALAFSEERLEFQATFTPWLRALGLNDVYLANLAGYGKISDLETVYGDLRYFSLGEIEFTDVSGQPISTGKPYEMAVTGGYARKLTDQWSASIAGRFILSSLASGLQVPGTTEIIGNGVSGAADIGVSYRGGVNVGQNGGILQAGLNIRNIGSKITYTAARERDFIPTNLGLGASLETFFDDYNSLTITLDANKLLVPSPTQDSTDADGNGRPDFLDGNPVEGIFQSFGDAEEGFGEELREINLSFGVEYWYANQFAARAGYFYEHATKGGRQYLTVGVGLKYNVLGLDFSYLVPTTSQRNPLDNTLRFGVRYTFENEDIDPS